MPDRSSWHGWHVTVDREACMGSGMCVVYAPNTFVHDEQAKAVFQQPPGDSLEAVQAALEACPTAALMLVSDDGEV